MFREALGSGLSDGWLPCLSFPWRVVVCDGLAPVMARAARVCTRVVVRKEEAREALP